MSNCSQKKSKCCQTEKEIDGLQASLSWFGNMIQNCYEYAKSEKAKGHKIVGIMCEYTPRELIIAAEGVPVCLCGGSAKMIPAAEKHLPANLCPLIKSTYGYLVEKANPFLEMADLIVAETTCDGKKKMYEIMSLSKPVYILELPQKPTDQDAFNHWLSELHKFKEKLEKFFAVKITDEKIRNAVKIMNRERGLRRKLAEFMKEKNPQLSGRELLNFKSSISAIPADLNQYENAIKALNSAGTKSENSKRPRVLLTGVPIVYGSERVLEIIGSSGGQVVCMDNCTGLKPILEDVDEKAGDPIDALAKKYFNIPCAVMTKNQRRMEILKKLIHEYRPDCLIELIWQNCTTYDVESYFVSQLAGQLNLPYLKIETDYSPSDSARIALRVEALFETIRSNNSAKRRQGK